MENANEELFHIRDEIFARLDRIEAMLESQVQFNGKQRLDNRDLRLMLKVCDRTLIRWRRSTKLKSFKICSKVYYMATDVHDFLRDEYYLQQKNGETNNASVHEKE